MWAQRTRATRSKDSLGLRADDVDERTKDRSAAISRASRPSGVLEGIGVTSAVLSITAAVYPEQVLLNLRAAQRPPLRLYWRGSATFGLRR